VTSNSNSIDLLYGHSAVNLQWATDRFKVVEAGSTEQPLTDFEIGAALDAPIDSPPLHEIVASSDSVLIVVSDATRPTASARIVNLLVRRLVASCGGFPYDINLIQAHKALDMASHACNDGGTIVLLAECRDGLGRPDFLKWFESTDARALADRLRNEYEVNGQTAWALMVKAQRYRVCLVSELPEEQVKQMRMRPARSLSEALKEAGNREGYVLPRGAAVLPIVRNTPWN
jgi:nickel-dependent lactate racemase